MKYRRKRKPPPPPVTRDSPLKLTLGRYSYVSPPTLHAPFYADVQVGNYTSIAGDVVVLSDTTQHACVQHPECVTTFPFYENHGHAFVHHVPPAEAKPVIIGSDVWIGYRALIVGSITIGHGAIVGAGAVVAKDVPPYAVVVGNPAQAIRYRFDQETIEILLATAWWDWPEEQVLASLPALENISNFLTHLVDMRNAAVENTAREVEQPGSSRGS